MLADFLDEASPGESAYIHQELLKDWPPSEANTLSDVNKRQLHHRAVRRLCGLLGIRDKSIVGRRVPRRKQLGLLTDEGGFSGN
jgi:hypothetical protein